MFVAASTICLTEQPLHAACEQLAEMGFDRIEISLNENAGIKPSEVAFDHEQFLSVFRERSRITPVAFNFEHDVPADVFSAVSKLCKFMQITQITVPSSPLGTPFNTEIDRLKAMLEITNRDGNRLSIKTKSGNLTQDPHTAVELCQAVKGLGLTLDPSYYVCSTHGSVDFDQVFPFVYHVHLRDSTPSQVQVQIGLGDLDYGRLINQLRRQRYNRVLSVELIPELIPADDRPLEMRKLRLLLETLL